MKDDKKDVGYIEDAFNCIANLCCAETHALNSYSETKDEQWLEIAELVRAKRSKLLYSLTPENKGELYCFLKHISEASKNFKEIGNRMIERNNQEYAKELFDDSRILEKSFILLSGEQK